MKTHWKKIVSDPDYLGEADFDENEEKIVTIARIAQAETITTAEGKSQRAVVHFKENVKPMILNVVRSKNIAKVVGSPYFEDWPGNPIQLYIEHGIRAFGEVVSAVRVRPHKPIVKQAVKCTDCKNTIQAAGGKGAEYIVQRTKKSYGVALCFECASKRAAQVKEGASTNDDAKTDG